MRNTLKYLALPALLMLAACNDDYNVTIADEPTPPALGKVVPTDVIYEANPRFFGTQDCLNGLSDNLQRISDLGCDILWIMPVCEPSTASQSFGSPYSIKNYTAINPKYGTISDLTNLVSKAHGLGMKVILDWVANHTGFDNVWITEHPDWFMRNLDGEIMNPPGHPEWKDVAQLNFANETVEPQIAKGMADAMLFWVTTCDVDGFRIDYASSPNIPDKFWKNLIADLNAQKSDLLWLAEASQTDFYSYGFDMIYDWDSAPTISDAFLGGRPTSIVEEGQNAWNNVPEGKSILRYAFNHDVTNENPIDQYYGSVNAIPSAYVCAAMLNGTPLIYSSMDAVGLTGTQSFFNYTNLTFSDALTPVYRSINDAFKATAEVRRGYLRNFSSSTTMAFTRSTASQSLYVIVNTTGANTSAITPITLRGSSMEDLINGGSVEIPLEFQLAPYEYKILGNL